MIVQLTGNVNYSITLDPSVWIFDNRKVLLDDIISGKSQHKQIKNDDIKTAADRWNRELSQNHIKPPVNKSISKFEKEQALKNSYVMPIAEFLSHAEVKPHARSVTLQTINGDIDISLKTLENCYLLFAIKGKPIENEGPVHLYFNDGSNREKPITGIKKIIINS